MSRIDLPNGIKQLFSSTLKLLALTTAVAAICAVAYGWQKGLSLWALFSLVVLVGQVWAFRSEIAIYIASRSSSP